jgi:hypothetical protein
MPSLSTPCLHSDSFPSEANGLPSMTLVSSSASLSLAGQLLVGQTNKFCLHLVITDLMVGGYFEHIRFAFTHEGCFVGFTNQI